MLGRLIRRERQRHRLSMREAARRIGISAAYLVELEHGRNPTTGRAPLPSPPVLAGIEGALGIPMATLLELAGAAPARSVHTLLVQAGRDRPVVPAASKAAPAEVERWIDIRNAAGPAEAVRAAAAALRAEAGGSVGVVFATAGARLRTDAASVVSAERTWEADVAAACRDAAGVEPAANVCVYREADLRAPRQGDPVGLVLALVRAHPHVALQGPRGGVVTGTVAIEAILALVRPDGIGPGAWASLSAAAAAGLRREPAAA